MATLLELPFCNKDPGKKLGFAMWPLGRPAGAGGAIPARPTALAGWERARGGPGATGVRFGGLSGRRRGRRWPSAAHPGGGRGSLCSGETEIKARQPAVAGALVHSRGRVGKVDWPRELAGTRLDGGGHGGRRRSKERRGRVCAAARGRLPF
jgi:hypothetical protein